MTRPLSDDAGNVILARMRWIPHRFVLGVALLALSACAPATQTPPLTGSAATVHPLATQAAHDALAGGGNAIDAAVAAALTLGVVDPHNSGIGGGCFMVIRTADGKVTAVDGRETAPAAAHRDLYIIDGKLDPNASKTGPLASGVPGALAAYDLAQRRFGRLKLADVIRPAAQIAERGFPVSKVMAQRLQRVRDTMQNSPEARRIFWHDDEPYRENQIIRLPNLARTYNAIAEHGPSWFYNGPFAQRTAAWMKQHGGIMTAADFAAYKPLLREPITSTYRGYTIHGYPPPSSGGLHVAQILTMLEPHDLRNLDAPQRGHLLAGAMKLAFADRAHWLGDPAYADVPRGLLDAKYLTRRSKKLAPAGNALPVESHGRPPEAKVNIFNGKHTTHLSVADSAGNWVAITATINTSFGSKVVIPGTGVVMNNEMDDFSIQPGVPNAFGLIGAEANAVEAGKRPLSSMSPTIVIDPEGRPAFSCGAAGGPTIINQVVQIIVNRIDLDMSLRDAVAAPRLHHQWKPDAVYVESDMPDAVIESLKQRGYTIKRRNRIGFSQAVGFEQGELSAVRDPRLEE